MSIIYSRLSAIRDYWMARDQNARVEVRVTDLDEILRELARTMPHARQPLTDEQIAELLDRTFSDNTLQPDDIALIRAIEAAHGIK
jgi:hypothetical protein